MTSLTMSWALLRCTAFFLAITTVAVMAATIAHTISTIIAMARRLAEEPEPAPTQVPPTQGQEARALQTSYVLVTAPQLKLEVAN